MRTVILFLSLLIISSNTLYAVGYINYSKKKEVKSFIKMMKKKFNYKEKSLHKLFSKIRKDTREKREIKIKKKKFLKPKGTPKPQGSWDVYARQHLEHNETELGVEFMHKYQKIFKKAHKKYGVPPEYITAIIGIESYYGKNRGLYYVLDTLTHKAFDKDNRRKKFYKYELQEFLRMCYREEVEPRAIKGSASGAIGLAQFMPSNYKKLAIDFNKDGKVRISTPYDAIGSIANYFKESGWKKDEPVGVRVSYKGNRFDDFKTGIKYKYKREDLIDIKPRKHFPYKKEVHLIKLEREKYDELWYGTHNFYVLTRYNHSSYYAMAVHQLAKKIKESYLKKYGKAHVTIIKKRASVGVR